MRDTDEDRAAFAAWERKKKHNAVIAEKLAADPRIGEIFEDGRRRFYRIVDGALYKFDIQPDGSEVYMTVDGEYV